MPLADRLDPRNASQEALAGGAMITAFAKIIDRVREYERFLPAAAWVVDSRWHQAKWKATCYQFDPAGECPPVMGLAFDNSEKGRELFRSWTAVNGNRDELEEIRITVIEGEIPGERPGYFVHISPDPENSMVRATAEGIVIDEIPLSLLAQVQRMHPVPGAVPMLPRFKELSQKHGEFLLAPVSPRQDGKLWADLECGIVKTAIHFRNIAELDDRILGTAQGLLG